MEPFHAVPSASGVVVETVAEGSMGAQAGIQVGDCLRSYNDIPIRSPWAWGALQGNTVGDTPILLQLERDSEAKTLSVPTWLLGVAVRPELPAKVLQLLQPLRTQPLETLDSSLTQELQTYSEDAPVAVAWMYEQCGKRYEKAEKLSQAQTMYERAWQLSEGTEDLAMQFACAIALGRIREHQNAYEEAERHYRFAAEVAFQAGYLLWHAHGLYDLGRMDRYRGNLTLSEEHTSRSLEIRERLIPGFMEVAKSLGNLGSLAYDRGDLSVAEDYHLRCLEIIERLAPVSIEMASGLNNMGTLAYSRGELSVAEDYYLRSLAMREHLAPDSLDVANSHINLGVVTHERGDFSSAEEHYRRSLAIRERFAPGSIELAKTLINLGNLAFERGDLASAEDYERRSLAIYERIAPDALDVAACLITLGRVAVAHGDLPGAEEYYHRSLAMTERLAPDSLDIALSLHHLGIVACLRDDLAAAETYYRRSLAIREQRAPESLLVTDSLHELAYVYSQRQQFQRALALLQRAVDIVDNQRNQIVSPQGRSFLIAQQLYNRTYAFVANVKIGLAR